MLWTILGNVNQSLILRNNMLEYKFLIRLYFHIIGHDLKQMLDGWILVNYVQLRFRKKGIIALK